MGGVEPVNAIGNFNNVPHFFTIVRKFLLTRVKERGGSSCLLPVRHMNPLHTPYAFFAMAPLGLG
jgi:hypothetical protein